MTPFISKAESYNLSVSDYGTNGTFITLYPQNIHVYKDIIKKASIERKYRKIGFGEKIGTFLNPFTCEESTLRDNYERTERDIEHSNYVSTSRTRKKVAQLVRSVTDFKYFLTFTFSPEVVDRYSYSSCSKEMSHYLKRLMEHYPDLKYVIVPEQHKDGAWHFHGLFSDIPVSFSGHYSKKGDKIYNVSDYNSGWTTATIIKEYKKSLSYILKYIRKDLSKSVEKGKKRYWYSTSTIKPIEPCKILLTPDELLAFVQICKENNAYYSYLNQEVYMMQFDSFEKFFLTFFDIDYIIDS